ncbi:hypothetical protein FF32_00520 [Halomonas campaniensis]|nr:hypothetical protein FF32_00520 [Halomonas campaniensis]
MSSWTVKEKWWDHSREILHFRLADDDGEKVICGITQIAINDYFQTEDTREAAEDNFDDNVELIVNLADSLIQNNASDDDGRYLITSGMI